MITSTQILKNGIVAAVAAFAVVVAASVVHSNAAGERPVIRMFDQTASAEQVFADAPAGVDPMVTGPVSKEFRQQQANAGCETAEWPAIPMACYPN